MHLPQADHQRLGAGIEQAPHQADQLVAAYHHVHSRAATAQGDQLGIKLQLIQLERLNKDLPRRMDENMGYPAGNNRESRCVCNGSRAMSAQLLLCGLFAYEKPRVAHG